jgi:F-type H+-transporting ATPase subunit epsilon
MLQAQIISPEGYLFNDKAEMIVLPTKSGEIGIMADHEKIITELQPGFINIYLNKSNIDKKIEIKSGFAKVEDNNLIVTILK